MYHYNICNTSCLVYSIPVWCVFSGGDGEKDLDEEESAQQNKQQDLGRLNSFIQKAGQVKFQCQLKPMQSIL